MDLLRPVAGEVEVGTGHIVSGNLLEDAGLPLIGVKLANAGKEIVGKGRRKQKLDEAIGVFAECT